MVPRNLSARATSWFAFAAVCLLYAISIRFDAITDDRPLLLQNPYLKSPSGLIQLWRDDLWHASDVHEHTQYYRPLVMTTFWLQGQLGLDSIAWLRFGNILLFACAAWILGLFLQRFAGCARTVACAMACLWAVHPLQIESVVWLSGRFDVLLSLTSLLVLSSNASDRRQRWLPITLAVALTCKEVAVVLLPVVLAQDLELCRTFKREIPKYLLGTLVLAAYLGLRHLVGVSTAGAALTLTPAGWFEAYGTIFGVYLGLTVWPNHLDVHHWYAPLPWPVCGALVAVLLFAVAWFLVRGRRRDWKGVTGFVLATASLVPVALIGPNQFIYGDRFAGLFWLGLVLMLGSLLPRPTPRWAIIAIWFLASAGAIRSWFRIADWRDQSTLMAAALAAEPKHVYWSVLESHRLMANDPRAARNLLAQARARTRPYGKLENAYCVAELRLGELDSAASHCAIALQLDPANPTIWVNSASVASAQANWPRAAGWAKRALTLRSPYPEAEYLLGVALANQGLEIEALQHVQLGLAEAPSHPGLLNLRQQLRAQGY